MRVIRRLSSTVNYRCVGRIVLSSRVAIDRVAWSLVAVCRSRNESLVFLVLSIIFWAGNDFWKTFRKRYQFSGHPADKCYY